MKSDLIKHIENQINKTLHLKSSFTWQNVSGGSINNAYKLSSKAATFFVKTNTISTFNNGFKEEVLGLQFLKSNGVTTPKIIVEGAFETEIYLVLSWVENCCETNEFWQNFAVKLADLHRHNNIYFGLEYDNFMGQLLQKNIFCDNFETFFIENRLKPQVKLAFDNGLLQTKEMLLFKNLYKQLTNIIPPEKPCAIHGDLWSGNYISSLNNQVVFIDPAVYYGHREVDLAMSLLFGGFSNTFYTTYNEVFALEKGFNKRKDIYNLYPLLIHLNLFGKMYLKSIKTIVSQF
ncbi:fructosamine kinase family protein [Lutibacter sp. A80]|uniref:fructosamine kinase family protein n=1 Tax=Lutibacter sp. A80 TaxID=2918453 RepID=UPI001F060252|nr:fructosamine kinase family protein [Lutibacter sp. A80]UMB59611.1 fructosamine kinase family protein [Lutibacter sp. A80]